MSDKPCLWGGEFFCAVDTLDLYRLEPDRLNVYGFPVEVETLPESFCAVCLLWWVGPHDHTKDTP